MRTIHLSKQIKQVDRLAAKHLNIDSYQLMQRAGAAIFAYVRHFETILVVAGTGNNAGDGFIIADLARKNNSPAIVWSLVEIEKLPKDAKKAANQYLASGGKIIQQTPIDKYDCIVDAIFGTGLNGEIGGDFAQAISWINAQNSTIIAVDIPSGLEADTGRLCGCVVNADKTVSIICYKAGLVTNNGKDKCGQLFLEDIDVPDEVIQQVPSMIKLLNEDVLNPKSIYHYNNSHKGSFGQVVIAGGHDGMLGALILAGKAALNSGCGLVETISNNEQVNMASIHCPELMTANTIKASRLLSDCDVIAIGPGLGLNQQSKSVLEYCLSQDKVMVIDADALTLIAGKQTFRGNVVLTPHPKEAAKLLDTDVASIQADRVKAARAISHKYKAVVILKGSGTVIANCEGDVYICPFGYSGMATAGMGDVLTGIVASLLSQGFTPITAAYTGVVWHALAAENCKKGNCLVASDVIEQLYKVLQ